MLFVNLALKEAGWLINASPPPPKKKEKKAINETKDRAHTTSIV